MGLKVTRDDINRIAEEECILLKDGLAFGDGTKLYDFKDWTCTGFVPVF